MRVKNLKPTGFCWTCGLQCEGVFCDNKDKDGVSKCRKKFIRINKEKRKYKHGSLAW